jgi:hypothetical protein
MSDYRFDELIGFWMERVIVHVSAIGKCSNDRVVGHLSSDNTSPVTCASELEIALH